MMDSKRQGKREAGASHAEQGLRPGLRPTTGGFVIIDGAQDHVGRSCPRPGWNFLKKERVCLLFVEGAGFVRGNEAASDGFGAHVS